MAVVAPTVPEIATVWYCDPGAAPGGDGSIDAPFQHPSDVTPSAYMNVRLKRGTQTDVTAALDWTGFNHIALSSYGDPDAARPILHAHDIPHFHILEVNGMFCRTLGIEFRGWDWWDGTSISNGAAISASASSHFLAFDCVFAYGRGVGLGGNDGTSYAGDAPELPNNRVVRCWFHDLQGDSFTQAGNTSWTFNECLFEDIEEPSHSMALTTDGVAAHAARGATMIVDRCVFRRIQGKSGTDLKDCNSQVTRSIFIDCNAVAILVRSDHETTAPTSPPRMETLGNFAIVRDNLIVIPSTVGAFAGGILVQDGGQAIVERNTIVNLSATNIAISMLFWDAATVSRNLVASYGARAINYAIGGRVTSATAAFASNDNLYLDDTAISEGGRFLIMTSAVYPSFPAVAAYLTYAGFQTAVAGLVEAASVIDPTMSLEGFGGTYQDVADFAPEIPSTAIPSLTGDGEIADIDYGARWEAFIGMTTMINEIQTGSNFKAAWTTLMQAILNANSTHSGPERVENPVEGFIQHIAPTVGPQRIDVFAGGVWAVLFPDLGEDYGGHMIASAPVASAPITAPDGTAASHLATVSQVEGRVIPGTFCRPGLPDSSATTMTVAVIPVTGMFRLDAVYIVSSIATASSTPDNKWEISVSRRRAGVTVSMQSGGIFNTDDDGEIAQWTRKSLLVDQTNSFADLNAGDLVIVEAERMGTATSLATASITLAIEMTQKVTS